MPCSSSEWLLFSDSCLPLSPLARPIAVYLLYNHSIMKIIDSSYIPDPPGAHMEVRLDQISRWNVYNRLRELAIPCDCRCGNPLQVQVTTATDAIQLWSVIQQFTSSKPTSIDYLERCWQQECCS